MEKILIVRLSSLGDVLHALPAVARLRAAFPQAHLGWAVEDRWRELLATRETADDAPRSPAKPLVDRIHTVDTQAWRQAPFSDETWREMMAAVRGLRNMGYDAAVDFQGLLKSALLSRLSGAQTRYGFAHPKEAPAAPFYTRRVERTARHVVEQNLELASALVGARLPAPAAQVFPQDDKAEAWCEAKLRRLGLECFALLSPGAGWQAKQWPPERYGSVARELAHKGVRSIVNFASGEEGLAKEVEQASGAAAIPLHCSLSELIALTRRAALFIGGDTGPMHLASALGVPVVALFGPTDPERNGPLGAAVVLRSERSQTSYRHAAGEDAGLREISEQQVLEAASLMLAKPQRQDVP